MGEDRRRECEARHWQMEYRAILQARGKLAAAAWWRETQEGIRKARGQAGLDVLLADIKKLRGECK